MTEAIATIGHNSGNLTPFEAIEQTIRDLYEEAGNWLDGEPITTKAEADAIAKLRDAIKEAEKKADELRKEEVRPHQKIVDDTNAKYNALIGQTTKITGLTKKALAACNEALKPYLLEEDRLKREREAEIARKAEEARKAAMAAMVNREAGNLAQRDEAERLASEARKLEEEATRASKAKAHAKGSGRAIGLRTVWRAVLVDQREAAAWAWTYRREELMQFIQGEADACVRSGKSVIPGFEIKEEKVL